MARQYDPRALVEALSGGDRRALARALSLVEQGGGAAREVASWAWPRGGTGYTVGITGAPGAGKSTLTHRLIAAARREAAEVAVLAVDPSSPFTGGAILGDRVRMQDHVLDAGVYIRSMATRGHLGGLALAAPQALRVLDAAGFPWLFIETVGVGQAEVEVVGVADSRIVVVNPGWGDSVQANKAGLLEIADVFVINKADRDGVDEARADLHAMLELSDLPSDAWRPPIVATVAETDEGVEALWAAVGEHRTFLEETNGLGLRRRDRLRAEVRQIVARSIESRTFEALTSEELDRLIVEVAERRIDLYAAADEVMRSVEG
jgi:LAO/AO transport system kinase